MNAKECIWKVRSIKNYPEARNHIFIGKPVEVNSTYAVLKCRTYHFGKSVHTARDIQVGNIEHRIVPWDRIEIVNLVEKEFDYKNAKLVVSDGGAIVLSDGMMSVALVGSNDSRVF